MTSVIPPVAEVGRPKFEHWPGYTTLAYRYLEPTLGPVQVGLTCSEAEMPPEQISQKTAPRRQLWQASVHCLGRK